MNSEKFYNFVKQIAGDDKILAESVIEAHKLIYGDTLTEGKLGKALATAGLGLGLMGANPSSAHAGIFDRFGSDKKTEMQAEQTPQSVKAQTERLLQLVGDDFVETNSFMDSENVVKLADYIKSLPEDLKAVALAECGRFKNQFRLGTPSDNIMTALSQQQVAMR